MSETAKTDSGDPRAKSGIVRPILQAFWRSFEHPAIYRSVQLSIAYPLARAYKRLLLKHLELSGGETILDVGCGTGEYAILFKGEKYIGMDLNQKYIDRAREVYRGLPNASFVCLEIKELAKQKVAIDHAYCVAVTHHLTDEEVIGMVQDAMHLVKGKFVVVDLYLPKFWRNPLGHFLVKMDRGRFGRPKERLLELLRSIGLPISAVSTDSGFPWPAVAVTFANRELQ
jgi:SAM-dependent methyltransferase